MTTLLQDMRYGLRVLWKSPGFTIVAVLSLALGVGANTAIFSIVNAVLLRSLPFSHPERLVNVIASNRGVGARDIGFSVPELDDLRTRAGVFDQVTAIQGGPTNLTGGERPQHLELLEVSANYFSMLGTSAHIGRVFGPGDDVPGFAEAIVISDSLWARGFGRDPGVLGRKIQLDNDPYTIVGVLPPGFRHPGRAVATDIEVWTAVGFRADPFPKPDRGLRVFPGAIGLLKPGIGPELAQSRLEALAAQLRAEYSTNYPAGSDWSIEVEPLQESLVGNVRPMLLVLMSSIRSPPAKAAGSDSGSSKSPYRTSAPRSARSVRACGRRVIRMILSADARSSSSSATRRPSWPEAPVTMRFIGGVPFCPGCRY